MNRLSVNAGCRYEIIIENNGLDKIGAFVQGITGVQKCAIITDSNVGPLYAERVKTSLQKSGLSVCLHIFSAGETSKKISSICEMLAFLAENSISRSDAVIALGGGVTGDMAGFAASIFLRGIRLIQIPTSLLAQIDSSVGGKTGVDLPQGKNLCGTFYQPSLVLIDPTVLSTLPERFRNDGIAEAIKYGCIQSAGLFQRLEREQPEDFLEDLIYECVNCKRQLVEEDELDNGSRMLLNFGHTFGHAIEKYYHFEGFSHGEAVGIGMLIAARAGEKLGITAAGTSRRIKGLLQKYQLPLHADASLDSLLTTIEMDKKRRGSQIGFVFVSEIGHAFIRQLSLIDLTSIFEGCFEEAGQ